MMKKDSSKLLSSQNVARMGSPNSRNREGSPKPMRSSSSHTRLARLFSPVDASKEALNNTIDNSKHKVQSIHQVLKKNIKSKSKKTGTTTKHVSHTGQMTMHMPHEVSLNSPKARQLLKNPEEQQFVSMNSIMDTPVYNSKIKFNKNSKKLSDTSAISKPYKSPSETQAIKKALSPAGKLKRSKSGDQISKLLKGQKLESGGKGQKQKKSKNVHGKKRHSLKAGGIQDFVLIDERILAIKNSGQLEQMLAEQSKQQKQKKKSKKQCTKALEKYIYGFLQSVYFQKEEQQGNVILDAVLFKIKDMSLPQKLKVYSDIHKQLKPSEEQIPASLQLALDQVEGKDAVMKDSFDLDAMTKIAVQNIQRRHNKAKMILMKLGTQSDHAQQQQKLNKLNQWKSKKFRQVMAARNFISSQRHPPSQQNIPQQEYLRSLNDCLQNEFDELLHQNFYHPLKFEMPPRKKKPQAQTVIEAQTKQERELLALNNPETFQHDILEELNRAKQIKQVIKDKLDRRVASQLSRIPSYPSPKGISTTLQTVANYLQSFIEFLSQKYLEQLLGNIRKCYGFSIKGKLDFMREGKFNPVPDAEDTEVIPSQAFVEFEQEFIGVGDTPQEKNTKYFQHIHNKAIFDLLNSFLNTFRPFYKLGQPLPWIYDTMFFSSFAINQENILDVLDNAKFSALGVVEGLCGIQVEMDFGKILFGMTPHELQFSQQLLKDLVESNRNAKLGTMVNSDMEQELKNNSLDGGIHTTKVLQDTAHIIFDELIKEMAQQYALFTV